MITETFPVQELRTPSGIPFTLQGLPHPEPSPTLFVFSMAWQHSLLDEHYAHLAHLLIPRGWIAVSLDLPCHGEDRRADEPEGLDGWRTRLEQGETFVDDFCARVSGVLDHLIQAGYANPDAVAACGTSRGGFIALHLAARDARLRRAAAFAPVVDLLALREFTGLEVHPAVAALNLLTAVPVLAQRAVWLCIGNDDARVGTDNTIRLAQAITATAKVQDLSPNVELHVRAYAGHTVQADDHEGAESWIHHQ